MDSADSLDERASSLAQKYGMDMASTRYALRRAEQFGLGEFLHQGVPKTEAGLLAEAAAWHPPCACGWLLAPSLEKALALGGSTPEETVKLFQLPDPWVVRQRRLLLLQMVPACASPFYTYDELAHFLADFVAWLESKRADLLRSGSQGHPFASCQWLAENLGPLYPEVDGVAPVPAASREAVLTLKVAVLREVTSTLCRSATGAGRVNTKAAEALWQRCLSLLSGMGSLPEVRAAVARDVALLEPLGTGSPAGGSLSPLAGSVTATFLFAGHCCNEIATGLFHRTRKRLGGLVTLDQQGRPYLGPISNREPVCYDLLLQPKGTLADMRLGAATTVFYRLLEEGKEQRRARLVELARRCAMMAAAASGSGDDGDPDKDKDLDKRLEDDYVKMIPLVFPSHSEFISSIDEHLPHRPKPPEGSSWVDIEWKDITLYLAGGTNLAVRIEKRGKTFTDAFHFGDITFRDNRRKHDVVPTYEWKLLTDILAAAGKCSGTGYFTPSPQGKGRNRQKKLIEYINGKLESFFEKKGAEHPIHYDRAKKRCEIRFNADPADYVDIVKPPRCPSPAKPPSL